MLHPKAEPFTESSVNSFDWLIFLDLMEYASQVVMSEWGIWTKIAKLRELNNWSVELDQYIYS